MAQWVSPVEGVAAVLGAIVRASVAFRLIVMGVAMIGRIVGAGVRARVLVLILAVAAAVMGVVQLWATPIEPVPEFAPVTVEVQSEALGLSAQEVEDLVTVPLESNLLSGVAWVDRMQSSSIPGLSSIVMTFEEGTDPIRARQVVQERLTQGALLTNASKAPVMLQPTSAANRVMMIGLSSQSTRTWSTCRCCRGGRSARSS